MDFDDEVISDSGRNGTFLHLFLLIQFFKASLLVWASSFVPLRGFVDFGGHCFDNFGVV